MKIKLTVLLLVLSLCLGLCACGNSTSSSTSTSTGSGTTNAEESTNTNTEEAEVTMIYGHPFSNSGEGKMEVWDEFPEKIYTASGGSMTMEIIYDGAICDDSTVLESIQNGTTQLGHGNPTYFTGLIPELQVVCMPGCFLGDAETYVENVQKLDDVYSRILEKYDLKYLSGDYTGVTVFVGNGEPITTPEDCAGKLIRTSGTDAANAVTSWGGASTVLSLSDLVTALERNTVDAALTGEAIVSTMLLYEVTDYTVFTQMHESPQFFFCSMDFWNSLSENQQNALMSIFDDVYERTIETDVHDEDIAELYALDNYNVVELTTEQTADFVDVLKPYYDALKENNSELGLELMQIIYEIKGWDWE